MLVNVDQVRHLSWEGNDGAPEGHEGGGPFDYVQTLCINGDEEYSLARRREIRHWLRENDRDQTEK